MYRSLRHSKTNQLFIFLFLFWVSSAFAQDQSVYVTKTGEKYHKSDCRYLKYSKIEVSLKEAISKSYSACSVCKPPTKSNTGIAKQDSVQKAPSKIPNTDVKKAVATRCTATTQAGNRCKRMTKESNGKCWQHQ